MKTEYVWDWCDLCDKPFVYCPLCGNNSCNGGSGTVDGKKCPECAATAEFVHNAYETWTVPSRAAFFSNVAPDGKDFGG